MAESKGSPRKNYGMLLQRNFSRTLERVKSTLVKSDKFSDEEFERQALIFREQQAVANRLQKCLKTYMFQASVMTEVTQELYQAMRDAYEIDWEGGKRFRENVEKISAVESSHLDSVHERVMTKMNSYVAKFPPVKGRIAKRGRKLTDYDAARRRARSLEGAKKRNEVKIAQAHDTLVTAKHTYESINQELIREIPKLYDSRLLSLCTIFEAFLNAEQEHAEKFSTVTREMAELVSVVREKAEAAELNANRSATEKHINNYVNLTEMTYRQNDETVSDASDLSSCEIQKYSEYCENYPNDKEEARATLASWSPTNDITKVDKATEQPSTRPTTGPATVPPARPPLNAVGVVADIHKGGNPEGKPASQQKSTSGVMSSVSFSASVGDESPAVVQQRMMLQKKKEQEALLKKNQEEEQQKKKREEELNKKKEEELLRQQMVKQRQQEEYLKQQLEQQKQRQLEQQRKEEQLLQQEKQHKKMSNNMVTQQQQITAPGSNTTVTLETNASITANNNATIPISCANTVSQTATTKTTSSPPSADVVIHPTISTPAPVLVASETNSDNKSTQTIEVNVAVNDSNKTMQPDVTSYDTVTSQVGKSNGATSSSIEERLTDITNETKRPDEDIVLYMVVATREYQGEDSEELNLEPGHIIHVLQRPQNQEDLDNGWLYGLNTTTKVRGIFQANFTQRM